MFTAVFNLKNFLSLFVYAWKSGVQDQLHGQITSAKIPILITINT